MSFACLAFPSRRYQLKMMTMVLELLSGKPENEQMLLSILVNKLTDRDKKTVSRVRWLTSVMSHSKEA